VNSAFEHRYGYSRDEVLGRTVHDLKIWDDPEDRVRMVARLQKSGPIRNVITGLRTKSGQIKLTAYSADRISSTVSRASSRYPKTCLSTTNTRRTKALALFEYRHST
jgi:PAS domain S-box-containing protein